MRTPFSATDIQKNDSENDTLRATTIERYERCSFCKSKLVFTHDLNLGYLEVIETGRCPGCGVAMNPQKYTLQ